MPREGLIDNEIGLLDRYMQAIGHVELLSAEEELALAERVEKGDKAARDQMILANLRLVVKIAYDYAHMGVPLIDLISEGNLGLIKSVERFNPRRGGKLSTYAAWWIRQTIKKALADQTKMIRLPMHMVEKIAKLRRATNEIMAEVGREPTDEEIAKKLHISVRRVGQLKTLSAPAKSLEAPHTSNSTQSLEDTLGDENAQSPIEKLLQKTNAENLRAILRTMDEREATVLSLRYGMTGKHAQTLDEIGVQLGLTRERVRQLEQSAQHHLRQILVNDDKPLTKDEIHASSQERAKVEVLRQFMVEKGLLK